MAQKGHLASISADNAHLPSVSVFIVLLAMMAALTTYAVPSSGNFEAARLSLLESFATKQSTNATERAQLTSSLEATLTEMCRAYGAVCRQLQSQKQHAKAILFAPNAFDVTVSGLSSTENEFLKALINAIANEPVTLTLLLPSDRRLDAANVLVLRDVIARLAQGNRDVSISNDPVLQIEPAFGFLIAPKLAAS